jgi:hypothetical protein
MQKTLKNLRKTNVFAGFGTSGLLQNDPRGDQNQTLDAKWPKVGSKSGPSAEKSKKTNEKSGNRAAQGPKKATTFSQKSSVQGQATIRVPPP